MYIRKQKMSGITTKDLIGNNLIIGGKTVLERDDNNLIHLRNLNSVKAKGLIDTGKNVTIGSKTTAAADNGSTKENIAIGRQALQRNESGNNNVAIGFSAGRNVVSSSYNTCIGPTAGGETNHPYSLGTQNTFVGYNVGSVCSDGTNFNVGVGSRIWGQFFPSGNDFLGSTNVAIGRNTMFSAKDGNNNIALGEYAFGNMTAGNHNIGIGASTVVDNGNDNICIGYGTNAGSFNGSVCLGRGASASADNQLVLGTLIASSVVASAPGASSHYIPIKIGGVLYRLHLTVEP